jgi:hypothetical protein
MYPTLIQVPGGEEEEEKKKKKRHDYVHHFSLATMT